MKPRLDETRLTSENILRQLSRLLFCNLIPFLDENGDLICPLKDLPEEVQLGIEGWDINREYYKEGGVKCEKIRVKLVSKIAALEIAMRYGKLLVAGATRTRAHV